MNRLFRLIMCISILLSLSLISCRESQVTVEPTETEQVSMLAYLQSNSLEQTNYWFTQGKAHIDNLELSTISQATKAKNIILFIGHGMGISTLTAARIKAGQETANHQGGEEYKLSFEKFPYSSLLKTSSKTHFSSDAGSSMTAMMTGVKSFQGGLAISPHGARGICTNVDAFPLLTLVDLAKQAGMGAGIVTTAEITNPTIAATYAKTPEYKWDTRVDNHCQTYVDDIATQLIQFNHAQGLDVILGGGRSKFMPNSQNGQRQDGQYLIAQWQKKYPQGSYIENKTQLFNPDLTQPILGLFADTNLNYVSQPVQTQPILSEMTEVAIEQLAKKPKGYFLVVESGRIGHAHENGNAANALTETIALADAVEKALSLVDINETLIVVTADHSYPLTIAGYPARGNPILGLVRDQEGQIKLADDQKPYTTLGYNLSPNSALSPQDNTRIDLFSANTTDSTFQQASLIPLSHNLSSAEDVALYATGPGSQWFRGVQMQSMVFHVINEAGLLEQTRME